MKAWFDANRRKLAVAFLLVFAGGGIWFFGGRMPSDVVMRFELPSFIQTVEGRMDRGQMGHLAGILIDSDGAEVGRFAIEQHWGGDAPLSKPVAMRLKPGSYRVAIKVDRDAQLFALRDPSRAPELVGVAEVSGSGEVRVDVRSTFQR